MLRCGAATLRDQFLAICSRCGTGPVPLSQRVTRRGAACGMVWRGELLRAATARVRLGTVQHGTWRQEVKLMERLINRWGVNYTRQAKAIRDYLAQYFSSEDGAVPWQERMVFPRGRPAS